MWRHLQEIGDASSHLKKWLGVQDEWPTHSDITTLARYTYCLTMEPTVEVSHLDTG